MKWMLGFIPVLATGLALLPGTAAVAATGAPKVPVRYYDYRAVDTRYEGRYTGDWRVCGHGVNATSINGVTFTCSESVTVTTTASMEKRLCVYPGDICLSWSKPSWVTYQQAIATSIGAFDERRA